MTGREIPVKRLIFLIMTAAILALCAGAGADPARTDGTVTAWIGEENELFLKCTDGITRKLSTPMKDILSLTDTDVIGLTQTGQIVSVKKEGTGYSILSAAATETEIAEKTDRTVQLQDGKLTVGETVFSERAAVAATDGKILYWINQSDSGFVLYYSDQCPFTYYWVPRLTAAAEEYRVPLKAVHIDTREKAQNAPSPVTNFSLFRDGTFITHEILNEKKFLALAGIKTE